MESEAFEIIKEQDKEQGAAGFTVIGRVNYKTSREIQNKLEDALNSGEINIVLNMFQVEYMSSDGIRVILRIHKEAEKAGGKLKIERPSEMVRNVLSMVGLNEMLN